MRPASASRHSAGGRSQIPRRIAAWTAPTRSSLKSGNSSARNTAQGCRAAAMQPRTLVVFDFDRTVIHANSDTAIYAALNPEAQLPAEVAAKYVQGQWTRFMNDVMSHMAQQGITAQQLQQVLAEVQLTPGMQELLDHLSARHDAYECIIVSDANTVFIDWILEARGLKHVFSRVITNPAVWMQEGRLMIQPYHSHTCATCADTPNLCKGHVLQEHLRGQPHGSYSRVLYLGDGSNDYCPIQGLGQSDAAFPRQGFPLAKLLQASVHRGKVQAAVVEWASAAEVLAWVRQREAEQGAVAS